MSVVVFICIFYVHSENMDFIFAEGLVSLCDKAIVIYFNITGILGSSLVSERPPHMISFEFEEQRSLRTSLDYFILHWVLLFCTLAAVGFINYSFVLSGAQMEATTLCMLLVLFSILLVPGLYGNRTMSTEDCSNGSSMSSSFSSASLTCTYNSEELEDAAETTYLLPPPPTLPPRTNAYTTGQAIVSKGGNNEQHQLLCESVGVPIKVAIWSWHMWVLCFTYFSCCGTSLMVIYNVNVIAAAVGEQPSIYFVSLLSLANGVGRLSAGLSSDYLLRRYKFNRMYLLVIVAVLMSSVHLIFSFCIQSAVLTCFLLVGFLFGCTVSLVAVSVVDLFGYKYVATNFGFVDSFPILGSYFFATIVVDFFYPATTATASSSASGSSACVGANCFQNAFLVNSLACGVSAVLCLIACAHPYPHMQNPHDEVNLFRRF